MSTTFWNDTFTGTALALEDGSYASDTPGDNYTKLLGTPSLQRNGSGVCVPTANITNAGIAYVADTAPATADQAVHFEYSIIGTSGHRIGHILGYDTTGQDGYASTVRSGDMYIWRVDDNVATELAGVFNDTFAIGDKVSLRRSGTTLSLAINDTLVTGSAVVDATYTAAGRVGIGGGALFGSFSGWDWWGANIALTRMWAEDESSAADDLTSTNITIPAPTASSPTLGQVHALTATGIGIPAPTTTQATLGQEHALAATDIAIPAPTLATPTLEEASDVDALTATDIAIPAPTAATPTLGQVHALTATDIAIPGPTAAQPVLVQLLGVLSYGGQVVEYGGEQVVYVGGFDDLVSTGIGIPAPTLDAPTITQIHALTSADITLSAPTLEAPAIGQVHALVATDVSIAPTASQPVLSEVGAGTDALAATNIAIPAPTIAQSALGQVHALTSINIAISAPIVEGAALGQVHALIANDITIPAPTASQASMGGEEPVVVTRNTGFIVNMGKMMQVERLAA